MNTLIEATDTQNWRAALKCFERIDVCHMPEYHVAYAARIKNAKPLMWCYNNVFCYPFLLTPVMDTPYYDISSIYGYSGALCCDPSHLNPAWNAFDEWAKEQKIIAEFTRFSLYAQTQDNAHPETEILENRPSAVSYIDGDLFAALGKKTRNMIRKAQKAGLQARKLNLKEHLKDFRALYDETMQRNEATDFFAYNDAYYDQLMRSPDNEVRLFGVFEQNKMVSAAISLSHGKGALYHLGASLHEYSKLGAGNLVLYEMSKDLQDSGVEFITVGGGRTTTPDDSLFRFKKSNSTGVESFYIGKRIVDKDGYKDVVKQWEAFYNTTMDSQNLIFYR